VHMTGSVTQGNRNIWKFQSRSIPAVGGRRGSLLVMLRVKGTVACYPGILMCCIASCSQTYGPNDGRVAL